MKTKVLAILMLAFIFTGCASNRMIMKNVNNPELYPEKKVDFLLYPTQMIGVEETPAVKSGDVTIVKGILDLGLFIREGFLNKRINWKILAVNPDRREFAGQAIFYGITTNRQLYYYAIIDGRPEDNAKFGVVSTFGACIYNASGEEIPIESLSSFKNDEKDYRTNFILKKGARIGDLKKYPDFLNTVKRWNKYQTRKGVMYSPIGEDELKEIAKIIPEYSFGETLIARGDLSLSMNPIGTLVGFGYDCIEALKFQPRGWIFTSDQNPEGRDWRNSVLQAKYYTKLVQSIEKK